MRVDPAGSTAADRRRVPRHRGDRVRLLRTRADAGIPHYWIVDLAEPVSLLACHLAGEFGYADGAAVTGTFTATTPFAIEIDLGALG